jgi:adenine-specific DNA-methyltransferase
MPPRKTKSASSLPVSYQHPDASALIRPEVGTQPRFKKKKPVATYRYDSSLSPELCWDDRNPGRELGEFLLSCIEDAAKLEAPHHFAAPREFVSGSGTVVLRIHGLADAVRELKALEKPFLNWAGKAERLSFEVPTLPLFIHERLSTQAILDSVSRYKADKQLDLFSFFGHPDRSLPEQLMKAYEHPNGWQNRMVLGDSLVVMNSLLHYENLGGQVQMIYIDPPYGVKFGSNFQPFVRKRDVGHNDDEAFTREPEMVKAYRDTWELGLHSYLTYLRDRLLLSRDLLTESGSIFVQISDENLHHVRELMDEVFGADNFCSVIPFRKKTMPLGAKHLESVTDYLIWFARNKESMKYNDLYEPMNVEGDSHWNCVEMPDGTRRKMTSEEINNHKFLPAGSTPYQLVSLYPAGVNQGGLFPFEFNGKTYKPPMGNSWFTNLEGMKKLAQANRLEPYNDGQTLRYVLKLSDSPFTSITNLWSDTSAPSGKTYVVQTNIKVVQRCMLMTTAPGDLVLDPTCGSGTTAFVAESWGRRWITVDTSRVPLALARQRILSAVLPYYELREPARGPSGGFVYKTKQNDRGEQVGGIFPYVTKGSIANSVPPEQKVLVDRPEKINVIRVAGPFVFEATIPTASNFDGETPLADQLQDSAQDFTERMIEVLRASPVLHLSNNLTVQLSGIRRPAKTLWLSAEAMDGENSVAILLGPEHGALAEVAILEAWQEASAKQFNHLYVIGFAIEPKARQFVEDAGKIGLPATYVQATPDILMGDLLKNMRSSQIFSVCGHPDVSVDTVPVPDDGIKGQTYYEVKLRGLDVFDPVTMEVTSYENLGRSGLDVPAWFLDTDYNGLVFRVCQAFFPRTSAWDNLKRSLKADFDDSVWAHLAGDTSTPFMAGEHKQIAVKVIDDRGNELMVVKKLEVGR